VFERKAKEFLKKRDKLRLSYSRLVFLPDDVDWGEEWT